MKIHLVQGDITTFPGDAIVNAANPIMLGGGGVDGAIHGAAGPYLKDACRDVWADSESTGMGAGGILQKGVRCPTGSVRPTPAFNLPCKWVIHTAGPVWPDDENAERFTFAGFPALSGMQMKAGVNQTTAGAVARRQLRDCYKKAGLLAVAMDLNTIAFPAISAGVYGCPMETCARVALGWAKDYADWPLNVTFYIFTQTDLAIWQAVAQELGVALT